MDYALVKTIHITAVGISLSGFVLRGAGVLVGADWVRHRVARTLPHIIDTLLLVSALMLVKMLGINPLQEHWLATKIIVLLMYIALGTVALKSISSRYSMMAFVAALLSFGFIVAVALRKSPWPF